MMRKNNQQFLIRKHLRLLKMCLKGPLPSDYSILHNSKPTILFFILSGLEILGYLDKAVNESQKQRIIEWIYSLQIDAKSGLPIGACGFQGTFGSNLFLCDEKLRRVRLEFPESSFCYDFGHLAQTYTSLCCLLILGDDLSGVDRKAISEAIKNCQLPNGSFRACGTQDTENDMRFVYCAVAICLMLNDFSCINVQSILNFIRSSISHDGGIGQAPRLESHGGSTYCALAVLSTLGHLWDGSVITRKQLEYLKRWIIFKQREGFHGRTNKLDDSCYAFWLGASLSILNSESIINKEYLRHFLLRTQDPVVGGFCKHEEGSFSDIMHTYLSLSSLSIFNEPLLSPVFCPLNISQRAYQHLMKLQRRTHFIQTGATSLKTSN